MAVPVKCNSCGTGFAVKDELAGKRIRCVKCRAVLQVSAGRKQSPDAGVRSARSESVEMPADGTHKSHGSHKSHPGEAASSNAPVPPNTPQVRQARIISLEVPTVAAAEPVHQSSLAAPVIRARAVRGPQDVQADNVRHTAAALSAPPEDFETLQRKVFASFMVETIEAVPVRASYRIGIAVVSLFMIMLPLVYVGLIGMAAWGTWYHATNHTGMISAASGAGTGRNAGRAVVFAFLAYLAPIVAGVVLILFMLKPLFSKPSTDSGRRSLKPDDEPLLFAFVTRICEAVGSPRPRRIDIDCNINASASFGRGLLSMFGNDLVLTIGMPLAAGLTMRQFAGVLAHEFGHFTQGVGMRLTYLIRSISYWFTRVVYERDSWDERLESASQSIDIRVGWVLYLVRFCVWLTRNILWVLMTIGNLVGGFLLRQMEFDADRHEARVAGSRIFATTARQLAVLGIAHRGALADLSGFYSEGRLGDNLPKLILLNVDQLPEKVHSKIDEMIIESKTSVFDTHPADSERMANAAKEDTDGIFPLRLPAAHLFRRFDFLSRAVTWDFYKEVFGKELKKSDIHPVDELMKRQQRQTDAFKSLRRFFQGHMSWYRAFQSPTVAWDLPRNVPQAMAQMKSSRATMLNEADDYAAAWKKFDECDTQLIESGLADVLLKAGVKVRKADFRIPLTTKAEVLQAREAAEIRQGRLEPKLIPFEDAATDRLYSALQLARTDELTPVLSRASVTVAEIDQLLEIFGHMNERLGQLLAIRDSQIAMGRLLALFAQNTQNMSVFTAMQKWMTGLNEHLIHLRQSFESLAYPFDHAKADISMADYLLKELPDKENPVELYEAADAIGNALPPLQARVLGRLCMIAEIVETHFGLPPLSDPPDDGEDMDLSEDDE